MSELPLFADSSSTSQRPWDARLARWLVTPLVDTRVTPNHLTTVRLVFGLAAAWAFTLGTYGGSNLGAVLLVLSNLLDHTDGELARMSGKTSRFGHLYDLVSDAAVTVLLFVAMGAGVSARAGLQWPLPPVLAGLIAGSCVALIFYLRMRIEDMGGKAASRQRSVAGFETEDVLYLMPVVTLLDGTAPFLMAAVIGAPAFACWVIVDCRRVLRRHQPVSERSTSEVT